MFDKIFGQVGPAVTRRASVFTPMLVYNFVVGALSIVVYWKSGTLWVFTPWLVLFIYSIYRHEHFALKNPGLLAPQRVALRWLDLTMGTSDNPEPTKNVIDLDPVNNPEVKQVGAGNPKGRRK